MTSSIARIGLLGGTFDPIHQGHLDLAGAAWAALDLTALYLVPSRQPPHRPQPAASSFHRFAMVAVAIAGRAGWRVSDVELQRPDPSFTAATLQTFAGFGFTAEELFFVLGADAFEDIASWRDYPAILTAAHFAVVSRPGYPVAELPRRLPSLAARMCEVPARNTDRPSIFLIPGPTADVSSTAIREQCRRGLSLAGMVPDGVRQHIEQHQLYGWPHASSSTPDRVRPQAAGSMHGQG